MPESRRTSIMTKIDAALNIIETDVTPDLTEEMIWPAFKETPSSYLIADTGALEARAALYVSEDNTGLLRAFVNGNVLDRYLVTGEVPDKFKAVMPAVADAYAEMHNHSIEEIPKEMKAYIQQGTEMGLDPLAMQERLINAIGDPVENARMERGDIAAIAAAMPTPPRDMAAFEDWSQRISDAAVRSVDDGVRGPLSRFETMQIELDRAEAATSKSAKDRALSYLGEELSGLIEVRKRGDLDAEQVQAFDAVVPELVERHGRDIKVAIIDAMEHYLAHDAEDDRQFSEPDRPRELNEKLNRQRAEIQVAEFEHSANTIPVAPRAVSENYQAAANRYRDWQMDLGRVEEKIIADSKVYDRDGVARVMQDVANTAATTGRADLADSEAGRQMLKAFVALEGRGAMQEVASGNMDALSEYVDTPANQRLVAKELLKSAKSVEVGLELDEIESGLEAVDPSYSRGRGYSI